MAFSSYLHNDPDYRRVPDRIDEDLLLSRVRSLRSGDLSVVKPIVVSLLRLAVSCVAEFHSNNDELIGVGLLTLQESVVSAATALNNDDIVPYVTSTIRNRLKDCMIEEASQVRVPGRSHRYLRQKGKNPNLKSSSTENLTVQSQTSYIDTCDTLKNLVRSHRQEMVMNLRMQRYSFAEISEELSIGQATAIRELRDLEVRYNDL